MKSSKEQQRKEMTEFVINRLMDGDTPSTWLGVTLTLRQGATRDDGTIQKVTRLEISKCIRQLMKSMNREIYGHAVYRYKKRLSVVPAIEKGALGRLHVHLLIEIPVRPDIDQDAFCEMLQNKWTALRWALGRVDFKPLATAQDAVQWTRYILKDLRIDCETLDLENLYLGPDPIKQQAAEAEEFAQFEAQFEAILMYDDYKRSGGRLH